MIWNGNGKMTTIPGFNQIQFESFCRFITKGLREEFEKFQEEKIEDINQNLEFLLFVKRYQLVEPLIKERDVIYESLTYFVRLYVPVGLTRKTSIKMQEQTVFIGNIPIMTSLGTFIINGIYRTVINQILQSPGIYYRSELDHKGVTVYTGTIISDFGGRFKLEMDRKARIWARVSRKQKISILILLSAMGSNMKEILENACYPEIFLSILDREKDNEIFFNTSSTENAILEFYKKLRSIEDDDIVFSESIYKEVQNKFLNQNQNAN